MCRIQGAKWIRAGPNQYRIDTWHDALIEERTGVVIWLESRRVTRKVGFPVSESEDRARWPLHSFDRSVRISSTYMCDLQNCSRLV